MQGCRRSSTFSQKSVVVGVDREYLEFRRSPISPLGLAGFSFSALAKWQRKCHDKSEQEIHRGDEATTNTCDQTTTAAWRAAGAGGRQYFDTACSSRYVRRTVETRTNRLGKRGTGRRDSLRRSGDAAGDGWRCFTFVTSSLRVVTELLGGMP